MKKVVIATPDATCPYFAEEVVKLYDAEVTEQMCLKPNAEDTCPYGGCMQECRKALDET